MTEWGLTNGRLEPWDFGHPGWLNERFSGFIVSPVKDSLVGEVLAWTPSTNGTVSSDAVHIVPPDRPTQDLLTRWIAETTPKVKGRIVLVGRHTMVPVTINKSPLRRDDEQLRRQYQATQSGTARATGPARQRRATTEPGTLGATVVAEQIDAMLVAAGAQVRVNDAGRDHGQIRAFNNRTFDLAKAVPTVVLRNEDYGRISRILADGTPVRLEFTIVNRTYPEGRTSYNTIAEIPGTARRTSRDARRPSRLLHRRHRRHRQCDRLRGDDGSGAHPQSDRVERGARSGRPVERRGAGAARDRGLREGDFGTTERSRSSRRSPAT